MVLLVQILFFRMVSAKLTNNYAFLIISLTMLGFAFSGIILSKKDQTVIHVEKIITLNVLCFAISSLTSIFIFYYLPLNGDIAPRVYSDVLANANWAVVSNLLAYVPLAILFSIPFIFPGLILGLLFTNPGLASKEIYFMDLIGSALGAIVVLPLMLPIGVENLIAGSFIIYVFINFFCFKKVLQKKDWLIASMLFIPLFCSKYFFTITYPSNNILNQVKIEKSVWDPTARIEISKYPQSLFETFNYPSLIGKNKKFHSRIEYLITQNTHAFTFAPYYDGTKNSLEGIEETLYASGYMASQVVNPKVFIIGVGGGTDILTSLYFDAKEVYAAEINAATIRILKKDFKDYFHAWTSDPRVHLELDEGRHALVHSKGTFDIIQLSGVDTYSGTTGAANVFAENYLYTSEAIKLYFSHLNHEGILNMMRMEHGSEKPCEMMRVLTTVVSALRDLGIQNPKEHIVMLTSNNWNFTSLLLKKTPFVADDLNKLKSWANSNEFFKISAWPFSMPELANSAYQNFLNLGNKELEAQEISNYMLDISPVADDRPFFYKVSFWKHLYLSPHYALMEYNLIIQFILSGLVLVACLYLPLKKIKSKLNDSISLWPYSVVAACIGIGFMFYEIALMQKLSLYLGHPNYSISVVLSSLLLSAGLGSLWADKILKLLKNISNVSYLLSLIILAEIIFLLPNLKDSGNLGFTYKFILSYICIAPVGFLLGIFMPFLVEASKKINSNLSTWVWGINAIFSVLGPIMAIAISTTWGFTFLMVMAVPFYLVAGICSKRIVH